MRLIRALFLLLLISLLFSSIVTLVYSQKSSDYPDALQTSQHDSLILSAPFVLGVALCDKPPPLNQSVRMEIYSFVKANPGVHFREICNCLNLSIGAAQYHLGLLTKAGLISFFRDGRYKRYFNSKKFGESEMKILSLLRHKTAGKILSILTENQLLSHTDLASKLEISSQALTWQINRLKRGKLIDFVTDGVKVRYFLDQENAVMVKRCLDLMS